MYNTHSVKSMIMLNENCNRYIQNPKQDKFKNKVEYLKNKAVKTSFSMTSLFLE